MNDYTYAEWVLHFSYYFFGLFGDFIRIVVQFPFFDIMVFLLVCYALLCLFWSLVLDG